MELAVGIAIANWNSIRIAIAIGKNQDECRYERKIISNVVLFVRSIAGHLELGTAAAMERAAAELIGGQLPTIQLDADDINYEDFESAQCKQPQG